ncbi:MAG: hypothetical protein UY65_C0028G0005 [Parcubacteria group bacterium GW2011_GWA2_51_12]|nr:MAG: hypothetical protein UY65_C0028G0005 [Parcubacteria group bacterium GW2011_GWA2_51_12]
MMNSKIIGHALLHSIGVAVYAALVAFIMTNGERIFGDEPDLLGLAFILLLLVTSAGIVGSLIFVRPYLMFQNGQKAEAVSFLIYTLGWLALISLIVLLISFLR